METALSGLSEAAWLRRERRSVTQWHSAACQNQRQWIGHDFLPDIILQNNFNSSCETCAKTLTTKTRLRESKTRPYMSARKGAKCLTQLKLWNLRKDFDHQNKIKRIKNKAIHVCKERCQVFDSKVLSALTQWRTVSTSATSLSFWRNSLHF